MTENWKRNIVIFLTSQTISLFGSSLVLYALMWHVTLTARSGGWITVYILCGILPTFFLSPFGGVWADRYSRKRLIILADSVIALFTLLLALAFRAGHRELGLLLAVAAVRALGTAVQTPAVSSLIPRLVPRESLTRVNGLNGSIQGTVMLVSPMVSGALMTLTSLENIFFIDVITAAVAVALLLFLLPGEGAPEGVKTSGTGYFHDLRQGFRYIGGHPYILRFFVFCIFYYLLLAPVAFLTPLQVTRNYGQEVWRLTAVEVFFSAGMILGGLLIGIWGGFRNRIHSLAAACLFIGTLTFALGLRLPFLLYLGFIGLIGVAMPFFHTPATVLLQEKVEEMYLGRVFGVMGMISSVMMPAGMLIFGPLADLIRIEGLLLGTGGAVFLMSFLLTASRTLVAAGRPAEPKVQPEPKDQPEPESLSEPEESRS